MSPRVALPLAVLLAGALIPHLGHAGQPAELPVEEGPARKPPLSLHEVLQSVDETHPKLEEADRKVEAADGKRLGASGAWDPTLKLGLRWAPVGFYQTGMVDATVSQATPLYGLGVFAGYRYGWGNFPVYKGDKETLTGGELRAGAELPLWKDGPIDERRADVSKAKLRQRQADCDRDAARLELRNKAAKAYWNWVAAGQDVRIQETLLAVATTRGKGLVGQAEAGARPEIIVVDNDRLILDRKTKLVSSRQIFESARVALSLFYRDPQQTPILVDPQRLPNLPPEMHPEQLEPEASAERHAQENRPELCSLRLERDVANVDRRLAKNQRGPKLNVQAFVAKDIGQGAPELEPVEFGAGVVFEMPLALRKARGEYRAANAEVGRLDAQVRGLTDFVTAEVRAARVTLEAAQKQVELARLQVKAARTLAQAEREKFDEGASDLVIVNLRELASAEAERLEVKALSEYQKAVADYRTATGEGF